MNIVEQLMAYDKGDLTIPKKTVELDLDKLGGVKFTFPIVALNPEVAAEIQEDMFKLTMKGKNKGVAIDQTFFNGKLKTLTEGCPEAFKNKELQEKFGARSPYELITILLTPGEIDILKDEIDSISGFDKEGEETEEDAIKN